MQLLDILQTIGFVSSGIGVLVIAFVMVFRG